MDLPICPRCYLLPWICESVSLLSWTHLLWWCTLLMLGLLPWRRSHLLCNWGRKSLASISLEDRFLTGCWILGCFWWSLLCLQSYASWYLSQPWSILICSRLKSGISSNIWLCTSYSYHRSMPKHQMSLQVQFYQHQWSPYQWGQWGWQRLPRSRCCTCRDACSIRNICQMSPRHYSWSFPYASIHWSASHAHQHNLLNQALQENEILRRQSHSVLCLFLL